MSLQKRLARKPPGYPFSVGRVLAIYAGLMVTLLLAALDQTIVATALPTIALDLHGIQHYAWVADAYLVTSTVTVEPSMYAVNTHEYCESPPRSDTTRGSAVATIVWSSAARSSVTISPA